jgi:hypothetical protein
MQIFRLTLKGDRFFRISMSLHGFLHSSAHLCTRPDAFPSASDRTSAKLMRLKSKFIECFKQDAAAAKSMDF